MRNYNGPTHKNGKDVNKDKLVQRGRTAKDTANASKKFKVNRKKGTFKGGKGK
jgi:hypothetical protein